MTGTMGAGGWEEGVWLAMNFILSVPCRRGGGRRKVQPPGVAGITPLRRARQRACLPWSAPRAPSFQGNE